MLFIMVCILVHMGGCATVDPSCSTGGGGSFEERFGMKTMD